MVISKEGVQEVIMSELNIALIGLGGIVVGGLISAITTFCATYCNHNNEIKLFYKKEEQETVNATKAIITELSVLELILKNEFAPNIFNNDEFLGYTYPLDTDYFVVYHANADKIGKINNDKLRVAIITIYSTAKFFRDALKSNNNLLDELSELADEFNVIPHTPDKEAILASHNYKTREESVYRRLNESKNKNLVPTLQNLFELLKELKELDKSII